MSAFPDYLLKLSVSFGVIAVFYHLVLRQLTFFDYNRHYLRFYPALCFLIPLININTFITHSPKPAQAFVQSVPTLTRTPAPATFTYQPAVPDEPAPFSAADWLLVIWCLGAAVMAVRLLLHVRSYLKIRAQSRLVSDDGVKIYHFDLEMSPFSFWNAIFYNPRLHAPDELQDMILHEYIHVRQRHSVDVIWSELICIVNWFNPFAWLVRSAIRQNLEYIADQKVIENHADTKAYQYLLLKTAVGPAFSLVNQFGYHSLKQRIVMMNRHASPRILVARFLFILPLLALLLAAFRIDGPGKDRLRHFVWSNSAEPSKRKPKDRLHMTGLILDAQTQQPLAGLALELYHDEDFVRTIKTDKDGFYYAEVPAKPDKQAIHSYSVRHEGGGYIKYITGKSYMAGEQYGDEFDISFLKNPVLTGMMFTSYNVPSIEFYDAYDPRKTREQVKPYLQKFLPMFKAEVALRVEYFTRKSFPKNVITLYKGGYFDRRKQLIGLQGLTKLYLNGREAEYTEVNAAFKNYPFMLTEKEEKRNYTRNFACSEISYITFPLYRDAPPAELVKGNVQVLNISAFDPEALKSDGYMLDGFRQVYGASSNIMPDRKEVKRVMLFKGRLARYYDPSLDKIWWIETRPVTEVFERPDFAFK